MNILYTCVNPNTLPCLCLNALSYLSLSFIAVFLFPLFKINAAILGAPPPIGKQS